MRPLFTPILASLAALAFITGCQTAPKTDTARANLLDDAQATLNRFERSDNTLRALLDRSPGFAVFPSVGKGGFIVGGGYGKGVLYERGRPIGYSDISQASIGFQAGAEDFSELIVFHDQNSLDYFKAGSYGLSAEASAIALKPGAAAQAEVKKGASVFALMNSGVMAEAAVAGQKFRYTPGPDAERTREEMDTRTRSEAGTATDREAGRSPNVSVSGSVSTPNGDTHAGSSAHVGASGSVSNPNTGDRNVTTDRDTSGNRTTTTEEKTTVEKKTTTDNPSR
jgi:lipid-binding SYLF domain-containing protein